MIGGIGRCGGPFCYASTMVILDGGVDWVLAHCFVEWLLLKVDPPIEMEAWLCVVRGSWLR